MGYELVPVCFHLRAVGFKNILLRLEVSEQPGQKRVWVWHDFSPMVLASLVSEQFAPFQNRQIKEVAIRAHPEVIVDEDLLLSPPRSIVRGVSRAVTAQLRDTPSSLILSHFAT
jgi:hypothetical protein